MQSAKELIERFRSDLWIGLLLSLISLIASFFEFRNSGWTCLFWLLIGLTLLVAVIAAVLFFFRRHQEKKRQDQVWNLLYNHQQRVETLNGLASIFSTCEKGKRLSATIGDDARVVAILPVKRKVGVMLNIGEEESVEVGTQLGIYRVDHFTSEGEPIEELIGLVEVEYVQAGNNCSQAVVTLQLDQGFWDQTTMRLKQERRVDPPRNFVVPYIPREIQNLPLESLVTFKQYLETIRDSLIREDQGVQEEGLK